MNGKSRSGNSLPDNVCVRNLRTRKPTMEPHKYIDASLYVAKMPAIFLLDKPDLKNKVKYSYYNKYYAYCFGRSEVDICSTCQRLPAKLKDKVFSDNTKRKVAAEKIIHS